MTEEIEVSLTEIENDELAVETQDSDTGEQEDLSISFDPNHINKIVEHTDEAAKENSDITKSMDA